MASMSSMLFVIDHNAIERTANRGRYWVPLFARKSPRKLVTDLTFVCDDVECGGRARRINATGKVSSGVDGGRDINDGLQVTTGKSVKKGVTQSDLQATVETAKTFLSEHYYTPSHLSNIPIDPVEDETRLPAVNDTGEAILDQEDEPASDDADVAPPPLAGPNVMNVILVAAECAPWSKTGGLGDVAGALPKALAQRGHRVMVVVPLYGDHNELQDTGVRRRYKVGWEDVDVQYLQTYLDGVDFVFIRCHMFNNLGNNIYGGNREDILRRMVLFCKAAVEVQLKH